MRVLFTVSSVSQFSGTTGPMVSLISELVNRGIDVVLACDFIEPGALSLLRDSIHGNRKEGFVLASDCSLGSRRAKRCYSLVHHSDKTIWQCDILHSYDLLYLLGRPQSDFRRIQKHKPSVYSLTGCYKTSFGDFTAAGMASFGALTKSNLLLKAFVPRRLILTNLREYDRIVPTSGFLREILLLDGMPEEAMVHIPVGIDVDRIAKVLASTEPRNQCYDFGYFGWGSSIRGLPDLLDSFDLVKIERPDATLAISLLGTHGLEERGIAAGIRRRRDIDKSVFLELGPDAGILTRVGKCRSVVLPFRSPIGFVHPPITLLESMAMKKVVISTKVGAVPEVITSWETGLLAPPRDPSRLAEMMLASYDSGMSKRIGQRAKTWVDSHHNVKRNAARFVELYSGIEH